MKPESNGSQIKNLDLLDRFKIIQNYFDLLGRLGGAAGNKVIRQYHEDSSLKNQLPGVI